MRRGFAMEEAKTGRTPLPDPGFWRNCWSIHGDYEGTSFDLLLRRRRRLYDGVLRAAESDVAHSRIRLRASPGAGPVAFAVTRTAQKRPAFRHPFLGLIGTPRAPTRVWPLR